MARVVEAEMIGLIGWCIWGALTLWTLIFTAGFLLSYYRGTVIAWASVNQTVLLWELSVGTLFLPAISRLHLLWLTPLAMLIPMVLTPFFHLWFHGVSKPKHPPGMVIFIAAFALLLWILSR